KDFAKHQDIVKQQFALGRELGLSVTPAVFLPNGEMFGGYLPPADLYKRLQQTQ
ncbi:thiol:disulfide interchange protein, partial [Vibrio xuii]